MRVLLVEDDRMIGESLQRSLRLDGFAADWVRDAAAADGTLRSERFDLVLLDLGLPPGRTAAAVDPPTGRDPSSAFDGLGVLQAMRARHDATPVIILTARDAPGDRAHGLDAGADDYLVKPFDIDELNARIRAVLRRHAGRAEPVLSLGDVSVDTARRRVSKGGVAVLLSAREFAVLEALLARPGAVLSRAQIEDRLYGWGEEIESNAVSVFVHQLRKKLGADFIRNVRGVGYYIATGDGAKA